MTDPSRRDGWGQEHPGTYNYPALPGSPYGQQPSPTEQLPAYSPYGYDPYSANQYGPPNPPGQTPPEPPKGGGPNPRRWLWLLAAVALLIVLGLVIGLVIVNSSQQNTVVAPPQTPIEPTSTNPSTTTSRSPATTRTTTPTTTAPGLTPPTDQTDPGATHTVVYSVAGEGRAISILYLDSGGVLQTEFNVLLPWTKEVQLTGQANSTASVSIVNVGRPLTCSITVDGTETQQNTGTGLTLCTSLGTR
jgi:cytoskeletal protein RodZ